MQNIIKYSIDQEDAKILNKSYLVEGRMGKGGADTYVPVEFADTRVSSQVVRLLIAVGEGVCDSLTDIFFNYVPSSNYNCTIEWRDGTSNQIVIAGFEDARNPSPTFSQFSNMTTIGLYLASVDWHAHSAIVTLTASLMRDVWEAGDVVMSHAVHEIYVRPNASATWTLYYVSDVWAKVSNAWSWDIRVPAPTGVASGTNWEIKIVRTSPDDASAKTESKVSWTGLTEVIELTLNYPNTALVGITLWDAAQFGGQIPDILFRIKGRKIRIPDNYEPVGRTYVGAWGGTFTSLVYYTSNPAFVLLDCLTSERCLGIADEDIDLPSFYLLGTICDELVTDGFGGTEPRYSINNQFTVRENVATFLNYILSVCNANFTTNEFGQLSVFFDRADQPVTKQVTNANVINGIFKYSSNDLEQRTGLVNVTYSNNANYGKTDTATWVDQDVIDRYGFQTLDIALVGCTSQASAIRKARWATYQNAYLTDIINFSTLHYGMQFTIGELVRVVDNYNTSNAVAGVITNVQTEGSNTRLYFDREVSGVTNVSVLVGNEVGILPVASAVGTFYSDLLVTGVHDIILNSPFVAIRTVQPSVWKVIGVEKSDEVYTITGVIHDYPMQLQVPIIPPSTTSILSPLLSTTSPTHAFIPNYLNASPNYITKLDLLTQITTQLPIPSAFAPYKTHFDGTNVWIACYGLSGTGNNLVCLSQSGTVLANLTLSSGITCITQFDSYLYVSCYDYASGLVYKLDLSGNIISTANSATISGNYVFLNSLTTDGTYIYSHVGASGFSSNIVRWDMDLANPTILTVGATLPQNVYIQAIGNFLFSYNSTSVFKFDSSGTLLATFTVPTAIGYLVSDGTSLFACASGYTYKLNVTTGAIITTYTHVNAGTLTTAVGSNFLVATDYSNSKVEILTL
jgi:hypothetical protein